MRIKFTIISIILFISLLSVPIQAQDVVSDLLGRINGLRAELGLAPYSLNPSLTAAAQQHANWMVATSQVTHIQDNGSRPSDRAQANGYRSAWVSENIYMGGLASVDSAWTFWVNSSIHYAGLTSSNFQDIGIAMAQGDGGQAFVLVFGNPGGSVPVNNASGASGEDAEAPPPIPIVGYDEVGNIQYELQAGQTLGDVLLIFGYTWDDLNDLMTLNQFTDADIRQLDVGQIVLVPPPQGTYTPTPFVEGDAELEAETTAEVTEPAPEITEAVEAIIDVTDEPVTDNSNPTITATQNSGIIPTPDSTNQAQNVTSDDLTLVDTPLSPVAVTASATASITPLPLVSDSPTLVVPTQVAQVATITPDDTVSEASPQRNSGPPLWLIAAIVVQVGVLGFASLEYLRRMLR